MAGNLLCFGRLLFLDTREGKERKGGSAKTTKRKERERRHVCCSLGCEGTRMLTDTHTHSHKESDSSSRRWKRVGGMEIESINLLNSKERWSENESCSREWDHRRGRKRGESVEMIV